MGGKDVVNLWVDLSLFPLFFPPIGFLPYLSVSPWCVIGVLVKALSGSLTQWLREDEHESNRGKKHKKAGVRPEILEFCSLIARINCSAAKVQALTITVLECNLFCYYFGLPLPRNQSFKKSAFVSCLPVETKLCSNTSKAFSTPSLPSLLTLRIHQCNYKQAANIKSYIWHCKISFS